MKSCVCVQPFPVGEGQRSQARSNCLSAVQLDRVGEMDVDRWALEPHHVCIPVGGSSIVRVWQPRQPCNVVEFGSFKPGQIDETDFENMLTPPQCKTKASSTCPDRMQTMASQQHEVMPMGYSDFHRVHTKVQSQQHKGSSFRIMAEAEQFHGPLWRIQRVL